jgi:6-phosphogluconolactonase
VQRLVVLAIVAAGLAACSDSDPHSVTAPSASPSASASVAGSRLGVSTTIVGAVYTSTNGASGNAVVAYARGADGSLTRIGSFSTGGIGMGTGVDAFGSQFPVILSDDHTHLYVVDAGSHDISVFQVERGGGLVWRQRIDSRGSMPVSLAIRGSHLYVLNQGDNSVGGFQVGDDGLLTSLAGAWQHLPSGAAGASTVRAADRALLVTERTTNRIDVFPLAGDGRIGQADTVASHGIEPFGFDIGRGGLVVVSEASANTVSSYRLRGDDLTLKDGSVPTDGSATCWIILSPDERFAFTANAGSSSVTAYAVDPNATIQRQAIGTLPAGSAPLDLDVTSDNRFVYAVEAGSGGIGAFQIGADGTLTALAGASGAGGTEGLAAF